MGLPWPPTWEEGGQCARCHLPIFMNRTPRYVYAVCRGITRCPFPPPEPDDPNGVIRLEQAPGFPCTWGASIPHGGGFYLYTFRLLAGLSSMSIFSSWMMPIFAGAIAQNCKTAFFNTHTCGAPFWPGYSGGTVNCFW